MADQTLLPLDGLAAGGKKYGKSGRDTSFIGPLTATGMQYEHFSAALVLPELELATSVSRGAMFSAALRLPNFTSSGRGGASGGVVLPELVLVAHFATAERFSAALVLDPFEAAGSATSGLVGGALLTLPQFQVAGWFGGRAALALGAFQLDVRFHREEMCRAALVLPLLQTSGNVSVLGYGWSAALSLPAFLAGGGMAAAVTLPALSAYGHFAVGALVDGWLLNMRNGAVTQVTAWPFRQMARAGGKTFAVGPDGLYELGGDHRGDGTTPVAWTVETGLSDLGSPAIKHMPYLYVDGIIDGDIELTVIDDASREYRYLYEGRFGGKHMTHRRKLGNAIRSRNFALRIASPTGAYAEFDALEPEVNQTQRSI